MRRNAAWRSKWPSMLNESVDLSSNAVEQALNFLAALAAPVAAPEAGLSSGTDMAGAARLTHSHLVTQVSNSSFGFGDDFYSPGSTVVNLSKNSWGT